MTAPLVSRKTDNIASGATPTLLPQSSEITPAMAERAKRVVAANAHGAADARTMLQMLGLMETPKRKPEPAPVSEHVQGEEKPTSCAGPCGRPFRPKGTTVAEYPGTIALSGLGMCGTCYGRHHAGTPTAKLSKGGSQRRAVPLDPVNGCKRCQRALRPGKTPLAARPDTVEHIAHGLCKSCYKETRKESAS